MINVNRKVYPVPIELVRILKTIGALLFAYIILVDYVNISSWIELPVYLACVPLSLLALGFFDDKEKKYMGMFVGSIARSLSGKR